MAPWVRRAALRSTLVDVTICCCDVETNRLCSPPKNNSHWVGGSPYALLAASASCHALQYNLLQ